MEGVGGHMVDYLGFMVAKLDLIDIEQEIEAMVMPDVGCNTKAAVLVGSNILKTVSSKLSSLSHIAYQWTDYPEFNKHVPTNTAVFVGGMVHLSVFIGRMTVVTEEPKSALPDGLVMSLCVLSFAQSSSQVTVEVKNFSSKPVSLPDKTVLCQLQQTEFVPPAEVEENDGTFDLFDWKDMTVRLTGLQIEKAKELIMNWMLAFSHHDLDMGRVVRTKQKVVRTEQKVYKKNGKLRFCMDFRRLNSKTKREAYTLPRIQEMLDSLVGAKWFSSLDI